MRPTTAISLLAVYLLASGARGAEAGIARTTEKRGASWVVVVSGYGTTREDAEQVALEEARERVAAYLRQREPSLRWLPSVEDLRRWKMIQEIRYPDNTSSRYFKAEVRVAVSDKTFQEILRRDRQLLAAKLLAALVALLAVAAGYFRLEEMTRGYYTGTLRVLVLLGVGLIGAGLWLIF